MDSLAPSRCKILGPRRPLRAREDPDRRRYGEGRAGLDRGLKSLTEPACLGPLGGIEEVNKATSEGRVPVLGSGWQGKLDGEGLAQCGRGPRQIGRAKTGWEVWIRNEANGQRASRAQFSKSRDGSPEELEERLSDKDDLWADFLFQCRAPG